MDYFSFLDSFDCIKILNDGRELLPLLSKPEHLFLWLLPQPFQVRDTDVIGTNGFTPRKMISVFCLCFKSIGSL